MARKKKREEVNYFSAGRNYCSKCWSEFTTLTEQERKNLEDRARVFKQIRLRTSIST